MDGEEEDGMTPLMNAAKNGHREAAHLLCSKGASNDRFDRRTAEEFTPLMHAALWGQVGPATALIESGTVHKGNIDDGKVSDGFTALCLAALQGQTDVVRLLLRSGADPAKGTTAGGEQSLPFRSR